MALTPHLAPCLARWQLRPGAETGHKVTADGVTGHGESWFRRNMQHSRILRLNAESIHRWVARVRSAVSWVGARVWVV